MQFPLVTFEHLCGTPIWYLSIRKGGKCQRKSKGGTQFFQTEELTILSCHKCYLRSISRSFLKILFFTDILQQVKGEIARIKPHQLIAL